MFRYNHRYLWILSIKSRVCGCELWVESTRVVSAEQPLRDTVRQKKEEVATDTMNLTPSLLPALPFSNNNKWSAERPRARSWRRKDKRFTGVCRCAASACLPGWLGRGRFPAAVPSCRFSSANNKEVEHQICLEASLQAGCDSRCERE